MVKIFGVLGAICLSYARSMLRHTQAMLGAMPHLLLLFLFLFLLLFHLLLLFLFLLNFSLSRREHRNMFRCGEKTRVNASVITGKSVLHMRSRLMRIGLEMALECLIYGVVQWCFSTSGNKKAYKTKILYAPCKKYVLILPDIARYC